jgi:hypothetical protein
MAMFVLSSHATLTGAEEKKTGPSRFNEDFSGGAGLTRISRICTDSEVRGRNVPSAKCQVSGRCRAQGWQRGRLNSELDEGELSCSVLRGGAATPLDYPTAKFPSPTTVYVNIKN